MSVGFYWHSDMGSFMHLVENLRDIRTPDGKRIPLIEHEFCLCSPEFQREKLEDEVLLHPSDNSNCFERVKEVVQASPKTAFYVLAQGRPNRIRVIGEHSNVIYVGAGCQMDFKGVMDVLNKKYLGFTLDELKKQFFLKQKHD